MLSKLQELPDFRKKFMYPTIAKFQYNMLACVDDVTELKMENLKYNPQGVPRLLMLLMLPEAHGRENYNQTIQLQGKNPEGVGSK